MQRFSEIDLMDLEPYQVDSLNAKETTVIYKDVVFKLNPADFRRIRVKEYWEIKDRVKSQYEKMKLLIFCYLMDRENIDVNWDHLRTIIPDERSKKSAIKPFRE